MATTEGIGAGGRGSGAVGNALSAPGGPVKLYAMADINENKMSSAHKALVQRFGDRIDVTPDRTFLGFDAYRKAIDCLRPGDVAMLTAYAQVERGRYEPRVGVTFAAFVKGIALNKIREARRRTRRFFPLRDAAEHVAERDAVSLEAAVERKENRPFCRLGCQAFRRAGGACWKAISRATRRQR